MGQQHDVSEADEAARGSKANALQNFSEQIFNEETQAVRDMYERAARNLGATDAEIALAIARGRPDLYCAECGQPFNNGDPNSHYCGDAPEVFRADD